MVKSDLIFDVRRYLSTFLYDELGGDTPPLPDEPNNRLQEN